MTRYEKQLQDMTIEKMAKMNVKCGYSPCAIQYKTSDYSMHYKAFYDYDEVVEHEI